MITFREFVRNERLRRGISQAALAREVGLNHQAHISQFEAGKRIFPQNVTQKIIDLFGEFIHGEVEPPIVDVGEQKSLSTKNGKFRAKAWLGNTDFRTANGFENRQVAATFLDEWQADYEKRHPHVILTEIEDHMIRLNWFPQGLPYILIHARRGFIPVVNGKSITSRNRLREFSEEYEEYDRIIEAAKEKAQQKFSLDDTARAVFLRRFESQMI